MAVLKGISANTQGKPLEVYLPLSESQKAEGHLRLPEAIEKREQLRNYQEIISHQERKRQEDLGVLGRLKERTWQQAVILSCHTVETISLLGLSFYTLAGGLVSNKVRDHQVRQIHKIQEFFDQVCPSGSILSGGKPLLDSDSIGGYLFGSIKLGFGIITYPTTLVLNTTLGVLTTGIEEIDRNIFKKEINYAKYLKEVEENPSTVRDSLNLLCFIGLSFLTVGKLRTPLPMAVRSQKALQVMIPSLGMGATGALGEQLMRVEDEAKGGFRFRVLFSDALSGALSSGIFMGLMKGVVRNQMWRKFADVSDGGDDLVDASAEYSRIEAGNTDISVVAKLARTAGYGLKLGTAAYDLGDTKVLNKIERTTDVASDETEIIAQKKPGFLRSTLSHFDDSIILNSLKEKFLTKRIAEIKELHVQLQQSARGRDKEEFLKIFALTLEKNLKYFSTDQEKVFLAEIKNLQQIFKSHPEMRLEIRTAVRNIPHLDSLFIKVTKKAADNAELHYSLADLMGKPLNLNNTQYLTDFCGNLLDECLKSLRNGNINRGMNVFQLLDAYTSCYGNLALSPYQYQFTEIATLLLQYDKFPEAEFLITKIWNPQVRKNIVGASGKNNGQTIIENILSVVFRNYCESILRENARENPYQSINNLNIVDQLRGLRGELIAKGIQLRIPKLGELINALRPGTNAWNAVCNTSTRQEDITVALTQTARIFKRYMSWQEIEELVQDIYYCLAETDDSKIMDQQQEQEIVLSAKRQRFCFLLNNLLENVFSPQAVMSDLDRVDFNDMQESPLITRLKSQQDLRNYMLEALNITNFDLDSEYDQQGNLQASFSHPLTSLLRTMREGLSSYALSEQQQVMEFCQTTFQSLLPQYRGKALSVLSQAIIRDAISEEHLNLFLSLINDQDIIEEAFEIALIYCLKPNDYRRNLSTKLMNIEGKPSLNTTYYLKLAKKFHNKLLEVNKDYSPSLEFNKQIYRLQLEHFFGISPETKDLDPEIRYAYISHFMQYGNLTAEEKQEIFSKMIQEKVNVKRKDSLIHNIDNYLFETISQLLEAPILKKSNLVNTFKNLLTRMLLELSLPKDHIQKSLNHLFYLILDYDLRNENKFLASGSLIQVLKGLNEDLEFIYPAIRDKAVQSFLNKKIDQGKEILGLVAMNNVALTRVLDDLIQKIEIGPLWQNKDKKEVIDQFAELLLHYELDSLDKLRLLEKLRTKVNLL